MESDKEKATNTKPVNQTVLLPWWRQPRTLYIVASAIVALIVINVLIKNSRSDDSEFSPFTIRGGSKAEVAGQEISGGNCSGSGPGTLSHSAMDPTDFSFIIPYGLMVGGHVTPIDHQYYSPASMQSARDAYPVYAMGDATLVMIEHRTSGGGDNQHVIDNPTNEYRLIFTQSCTFLYYYDLVTSLDPAIQQQFDETSNGGRSAYVNIPVTAGQQIGRIGGQTLDFAVWDTEKPLTGFAEPEHYKQEPWKLYTADPLNYMTPDLKELWLARSPRTEEPISGKIDWDIPGKLRGSWFLEGTDYSGDQNNPESYWTTQLSFSPDLYDNTHFVISIGNYGSRGSSNSQSAQQFYANGNSPDPAEVSPDSGLVKYELVDGLYKTGSGASWDRMSLAHGITVETQNYPAGTVIVQMIADDKIKFEVFKDKTGSEVSGFTENALIYTR